MSKIGELLQKYCPNGVEYKTLGELGCFYGGITGKSKEDFVDGNATFITYRNVYSNPALDIFPADKVKIGESENQRTLKYGDVIFTGSSETPDECGISSVVTEEVNDDLYLNSFCFFFRFDDLSKIEPSFMKHLFRSNDLRYQIGKTASGVTRYNVSKKLMAKVVIPVPPLEVQREIVKILDEFTLLTAELSAGLSAELKARNKQYNYYRELLLSDNGSAPVKRLGDTCRMKSGKAIKASMLKSEVDENHKYQCFGGNGIRGYIGIMSHSGEFPIIGRQGALCGNVNYARGKFYATEHAVVVESLGKYNQRYLYYLLTSMNLNQYKSQGAQPGLAVGNIENLLAPVPTLERQKQIVTCLDQFESISKDMNIRLTSEIDARKKQYEYYRDKLLEFKEKI